MRANRTILLFSIELLPAAAESNSTPNQPKGLMNLIPPPVTRRLPLTFLALFVTASTAPGQQEAPTTTWQELAVARSHILSHVKWTPVADTLPNRKGGFFEKGKEVTGVPYSSVSSVGRCIGFDISLRTFLAAVENPHSVLYTENLTGKVSNAAAYYGSVCSAFTSYALGCGAPVVSRRHGPDLSKGVVLVEPQAAEAAQVGDVIYTPPATPTSGSHVEIITAVARDEEGRVVSIRVEESRPPSTSITHRTPEKLTSTWLSKTNSSSASQTSTYGAVTIAPSHWDSRTSNSMPPPPSSTAPSCSI